MTWSREFANLHLSRISTTTVPVLGSVSIEGGSGATSDLDASTADCEERTFPLFLNAGDNYQYYVPQATKRAGATHVSESRRSLEDNNSVVLQSRHVKSNTSWDSQVLENDGIAGSLGLDSSSILGIAEGASNSTLLKSDLDFSWGWRSSWSWHSIGDGRSEDGQWRGEERQENVGGMHD